MAQLVEQLTRNEQVAGSNPAGGSSGIFIMTKEAIRQSVKQAITDRGFVLLMFALLLAGMVYATVIGLSIHSRDVQIYTRYTAFGEAHFYKSPWQYTILFVVFGIAVTAVHTALMVKLYALGRRQSGLLVGWLGIAVLAIAMVIMLSIIGFAFQ